MNQPLRLIQMWPATEYVHERSNDYEFIIGRFYWNQVRIGCTSALNGSGTIESRIKTMSALHLQRCGESIFIFQNGCNKSKAFAAPLSSK